MTALEAAGVPTGPIHDVAEVFADPQVVAREMRVDLKEREEGGATIPGVRTPIRFSATPARYDHPSPRIGADTAEIAAAVRAGKPGFRGK